MNILRNLSACLTAAFLAVALGGCLFDSPLTGNASTNIDTRLLGVFEFTEQVTKTVNGEEVIEDRIHRVGVLPKNEDEYLVYYRNYGDKPVKTLVFTGWISRVDDDYFLTLRDETEGSQTFGKFSFQWFEWKWPANFRTYAPDLGGLEHATSYQLRKAVREKRKSGTLFPYEATLWQKIARIYWDPKNPEPITTLPPEFEKGSDLKSPGL